jgi:superfamily II DNA or RNA helicase
VVRIGFDATPFTYDDQVIDWTIKKCIGDVIYEKSTKELIDMKLLVRPIIGMIKIHNDSVYKGLDYRTAYKDLIVTNADRNNMIRKIVEKENGRILVLIREIEHGRQLMHLIKNAIFLHGEIDSMERYNEIQNFINSEDKFVLIGSTIFDEGIDFEKGIDAIIIASAGKGFRKVVQRLGRALRPNKKGYVSVYDFYDEGNKHLEKHSKARFNIYKNEQHSVSLI